MISFYTHIGPITCITRASLLLSISVSASLRLHFLPQIRYLETAVLDDSRPSEEVEPVSWLVDQLHEEQPENMTRDEANVVYYIAGCLGRSIARQKKCSECKICLTETPLDAASMPDIPEEHTRSRLLQLVNRGGLAAPSEYSMSVCIFGFLYFKQIFDSPQLAKQMFQRKAHAELFSSAVLHILQEDPSLCALTTFSCERGHSPFVIILKKLFNCLSKNVLSRLHRCPPVTLASDSRKLRKIQSCSTAK